MPEVGTAKPGHVYVDAVRQSFGAAILEEAWQADDQVTLTVDLNSLPDIVEALYYRHNGWLGTIAANDERKLNGHYALYYILSMEGSVKSFVVVRGLVPASRPEFPSVTPRVPAMVWGEREARDMFGLQPVGLPDARRLVLPDDWPDDLYPLRKDTMDYRTRPPLAADTETYKFINTTKGESQEVPLGPLHITSDEPGHFRLFVDGEQIVDADYRLFYVHRGMEKLAETRMGYNEVPFLADRICGICGFTHSVAYVSSVETALVIRIPERAHFIRTILLEVERLHSHLLNIGLACHFVGFDTGFMQFFRVREKAMTMAELLTGARKTYAMNLVGGVRRDILKDERTRTLELIRELRTEVTALLDILVSTPNMLSRTKNVGRLDPQVARDYSPCGPVIRASGYERDTRVDHPYSAYAGIPIRVRTMDGCDVFSRVMIRGEEFHDSLAIIEYCLDQMPEGPILVEGFTYAPHRFALGCTEAPRGEDVHWTMLGDNQKLYRWRCRAPTYANWPPLRYMLRDNTIADAPLIVGSIDPCYSCTDRVTLIDIRKRNSRTVPYKEIERYCRERKDSPVK
jgi:Ni,Fe-hydrogenase III large subunit/Ni,Fe-hydrogenase III component G